MGKSSKAISKTKARSMTRKPKSTSRASLLTASGDGNGKGKTKPKDLLLAKLLEAKFTIAMAAADHDEDEEGVTTSESSTAALSFSGILESLGMNDRNTGWRNAWKDLIAHGFIEQADSNGGTFTSGFVLTQKGVDVADESGEFKETLGKLKTAKPKTNAEHHQRIKERLINKRGDDIFDLLLERGPLTRKELAAAIGISDTGAYFSYALQQLKELGYAEKLKGGKVQLTKKAFVAPRDENEKETAETKEGEKEEE